MTEFNVNSKTVAQCHIKENDKLVITADYAFTFAELRPHPNPDIKVALNGNTLACAKNVGEPKIADPKTPIAMPPISE